MNRCSKCGNRLDFCVCVDQLLASAIDPAVLDDLAAHDTPTPDGPQPDPTTGVMHEACGGGAIIGHKRVWCTVHHEWHLAWFCVRCRAWIDDDREAYRPERRPL